MAMSSDLSDPSRLGTSSGLEPTGAERLVLRDILANFERDLIVTVLFAARGNQKRAADALGVLPTTFQEKLKRFGIINQRQGQRVRGGERTVAPGDSIPPRPRGGQLHKPPPEDSRE